VEGASAGKLGLKGLLGAAGAGRTSAGGTGGGFTPYGKPSESNGNRLPLLCTPSTAPGKLCLVSQLANDCWSEMPPGFIKCDWPVPHSPMMGPGDPPGDGMLGPGIPPGNSGGVLGVPGCPGPGMGTSGPGGLSGKLGGGTTGVSGPAMGIRMIIAER
jgi:hypothetical protein